MNRSIHNRIKRAIKSNLGDKAGQIIESGGLYLSKRDLISIIRYMIKINTYSYGVIRYIYYVSPHRHSFSPISNNRLLYLIHEYPAIFELLWSDDRVVQEYKRIKNSHLAFSINDTYYNARSVLANGSMRVVRFLLNKLQIRSESMLDFALEKAVEKGHTSVVKLLFEQPYVRNLSPTSCGHALKMACSRGYYDIVSILLESHVYLYTAALDKAMALVCINGDVKIFKLLLEDPRTNPAYLSNCLIYDACSGEKANPTIVKLLLEDERVNPANYILNPITTTERFEVIEVFDCGL